MELLYDNRDNHKLYLNRREGLINILIVKSILRIRQSVEG